MKKIKITFWLLLRGDSPIVKEKQDRTAQFFENHYWQFYQEWSQKLEGSVKMGSGPFVSLEITFRRLFRGHSPIIFFMIVMFFDLCKDNIKKSSHVSPWASFLSIFFMILHRHGINHVLYANPYTCDGEFVYLNLWPLKWIIFREKMIRFRNHISGVPNWYTLSRNDTGRLF